MDKGTKKPLAPRKDSGIEPQRSVDPSAPKPGTRDYAHSIAKIGLSAIPLAGGPLAEAFAAIIGPPISRRRDAWVESIATRLNELAESVEGFDPENLAQYEEFASVVILSPDQYIAVTLD